MNKLTPREPTPEMLMAGRFASALEVIAEPIAIWRAMHDAAPSVPSVEQELALIEAVLKGYPPSMARSDALRACAAIARAKGE